jgi:signal transduction histidine kinase
MEASDAGGHRLIWARAAHELRQPIQCFALLSQLLAHTEDGAERCRLADLLEDRLVELQDMLDQLAWLARLELGLEMVKVERLDLRDLAGGVVAAVAPRAARAGLSIRSRVAAFALNSDRRLLRALLLGLLLNAIKLGSGDRLVFAAQSDGDHCRIDVSFTSAALPGSVREAAFIELSRDDGEPGVAAGLGLAARLAAAIGGRLEHASLSPRTQRIRCRLPHVFSVPQR